MPAKSLKYLSICSGIEAATVAWHGLSWQPAGFSEIDPFARAVLAHHYPDVPLHGDFTALKESDYAAIDLLVGGTPCQSFSIAGLRKGLADDRGNLTLEYIRLAERTCPRWLVWENVPGVLSIDEGLAFGAFLGGLAECGYGFAYRIFDAQYFGVPQRRRRVFVVGHFGDWRPAAAVLFERESLRRDITPRRESREAVAALTATGVGTCGADDNQGQAGHLIAHTLRADGFDASEDGSGRGVPLLAFGGNNTSGSIDVAAGLNAKSTQRQDFETETLIAFSAKDYGNGAAEHIAPTLRAMTHDGSHSNGGGQLAVAFAQNSRDEVRMLNGDGSLAGALPAQPGMKQQTFVAGCFKPGQSAASRSIGYEENVAPSLEAGGGGNNRPAILHPLDLRNATRDPDKRDAVNRQSNGIGGDGDPSPTISTAHMPGILSPMAVRRLTPRECERLQGFPDDYTLIPYHGKPAADGPRYKALGNSMAVPVMRWLGERIQKIEAML